MHINNIAIKFTPDRMEAFLLQCRNVLNAYEPETPHEALLFEHLVELADIVDKKLRANQKSYRINMNGSMAVAFYQLWQNVNLAHDPYSRIIVEETLAQIDKAHKSPARKYRYSK